jgi:hypothetical protein
MYISWISLSLFQRQRGEKLHRMTLRGSSAIPCFLEFPGNIERMMCCDGPMSEDRRGWRLALRALRLPWKSG